MCVRARACMRVCVYCVCLCGCVGVGVGVGVGVCVTYRRPSLLNFHFRLFKPGFHQ